MSCFIGGGALRFTVLAFLIIFSISCKASKSVPPNIKSSFTVSKKSVKNISPDYSKNHEPKITVEFFSDVKCKACQKMHKVITELEDFLTQHGIKLNLIYRPVVTKEDSVNAAFIAAEALNRGQIDEFLKMAYPNNPDKIDDLNPELIGARIGISEIHKTPSISEYIKANQSILKEKGNNTAPLLVIKNYDHKNHDIYLTGCQKLSCVIKILKQHGIIKIEN